MLTILVPEVTGFWALVPQVRLTLTEPDGAMGYPGKAPWLCRSPVVFRFSESLENSWRILPTQTLLGLPMEDPDLPFDTPEGFWGLKTWLFEGPK